MTAKPQVAPLPGDHYRSRKKGFRLALTHLVAGACVALVGCMPAGTTPVPPHLNTTISSDGKVVAVMSYVDNFGKKRVRYKRLEPEGPWQELAIPMHVNSIRFGLKGHELMLTRRVDPAKDSWGELFKVDLDDPQQAPQKIYEAYGVQKPVEVTPGEIMVHSCATTKDNNCHSTLGWQWDLVRNGKLVHRWPYGKEYGNMNYGWPNVVPGQGAFWFKIRGYYKPGEPFPDFWSLAFPGKTGPKYTEPLGEDSEALYCDYQMERCIREYRRNSRNKELRGYDREVMWRGQVCELQGVDGDRGDQSFTPNGLASVMSLFKLGDEWHHVVVFKFAPNQCKPTLIRHIQLEEK
jgi:hypothetical protein